MLILKFCENCNKDIFGIIDNRNEHKIKKGTENMITKTKKVRKYNGFGQAEQVCEICIKTETESTGLPETNIKAN